MLAFPHFFLMRLTMNGLDMLCSQFYCHVFVFYEHWWLSTLYATNSIFLHQLGHYHVMAPHAFFEDESFVHRLDHARVVAPPASFETMGLVRQLELQRVWFLLPPLRQRIAFRSYSHSLHHNRHLIECLLESSYHFLESLSSNKGIISMKSFLLLVHHRRRRVLSHLALAGIGCFCIVRGLFFIRTIFNSFNTKKKVSNYALFLVLKC